MIALGADPTVDAIAAVPRPGGPPLEPPRLDRSVGEAARESVRWGVRVSAIRCVVSYVIAPLVGGFAGFWGAIGLGLQLAAGVIVIAGTRSLWRGRHRWRVLYTLVAAVVVATTGLTLASVVGAAVGAIR